MENLIKILIEDKQKTLRNVFLWNITKCFSESWLQKLEQINFEKDDYFSEILKQF